MPGPRSSIPPTITFRQARKKKTILFIRSTRFFGKRCHLVMTPCKFDISIGYIDVVNNNRLRK